MSRPKVDLRPVADAYSSPAERIVEFSDRETGAGGLISIRRGDGELIVDVYRCDGNVRVLRRPTEAVASNRIGEPLPAAIERGIEIETALAEVNDSGLLPAGTTAVYDRRPIVGPHNAIGPENAGPHDLLSQRRASWEITPPVHDDRLPAEELRRVYEDAEPELPADPTGVDCVERYESPKDQS